MNTHKKHPLDSSERNNHESKQNSVHSDSQAQNEEVSGEEVRGDTWEDRDRTFGGEAESNFPEDTAQADRIGNSTQHDASGFFEEDSKGHFPDVGSESVDEKHRRHLHDRKHHHKSGNTDPGFGATDRG